MTDAIYPAVSEWPKPYVEPEMCSKMMGEGPFAMLCALEPGHSGPCCEYRLVRRKVSEWIFIGDLPRIS